MSSNGIVLPPVGISDVRSTEATQKLKVSTSAGKEKIEQSAKQFEAVLMSHWLDQAEQSFATVPGGDPDGEDDQTRDQYHSPAPPPPAPPPPGPRPALGIANMVAKHLEAMQQTEKGEPNQLKLNGLSLHPAAGAAEGKK